MPNKEFISQLFQALSWVQKLFIGAGSLVIAAVLYTTTLNACMDRRIVQAVEPRFAPLADMVEFSLKRQGIWGEYQLWAAQKACDDQMKRGENCESKGGRMPIAQ